MKKLIIILSFVFISSALAVQPPGFGSVQDNNDGNKGQILVNTGNDHGNSDIGTWVNADFLKGNKGDKGDTGARGKQGVQGEKGDKGDKGDQGERGKRGKQGKKGDTGEQGIKGNDGKDGVNGVDGQNGKNGDTITVKRVENGVEVTSSNETSAIVEDGQDGEKGDRGKDVDPKTVNNLQEQINQLQEPKYYLVPQVRVYDGKRLEVKPYAKFDVQNNMDFREAGLKITVKIGKSYEEKLIEELAEKIETFVGSKKESNLNYTYDANGHVIDIKTKF